MFLYNVTLNIDISIHDEWLAWVGGHIAQVLATEKFEKATLTRVLVEDNLEHTYSIQYKSYSREALDAYYKEYEDLLRVEGLKKFEDKMLAFSTELQIIDEYYNNS